MGEVVTSDGNPIGFKLLNHFHRVVGYIASCQDYQPHRDSASHIICYGQLEQHLRSSYEFAELPRDDRALDSLPGLPPEFLLRSWAGLTPAVSQGRDIHLYFAYPGEDIHGDITHGFGP